MNALIAKAQTSKTAQLKEMAITLAADLRDEATLVLEAVMNILEGRLPEAEFVSFCEEVEAAI